VPAEGAPDAVSRVSKLPTWTRVRAAHVLATSQDRRRSVGPYVSRRRILDVSSVEVVASWTLMLMVIYHVAEWSYTCTSRCLSSAF